jgi:hypothetical protein
MGYRSSTGAFALATVLTLSIIDAQAFDETKYPNWKGQWVQLGGNQSSPWDPTKPPGTGQQAPLTPEYQAIFEASVKSAADGGLGPDPTARCIPPGVPRVMIAAQPMEIVISPDVTYLMLEQTLRRVHTDGRKFPDHIEPSFTGTSIGQWQDTDGDGRFDTLVIETSWLQGAAHLRRKRHSLPRGWRGGRHREALRRQNQSEHLA